MIDKNRSSKFGVGVLIGTVLGGLAAFFLSPKSGPENREMVEKKLKEVEKWLEDAEIPEHVKEIYGDVTEEGTKLYKNVSKALKPRIKEIQQKMEDFDAEKYKKLVGEVVEAVQTEADVAAHRASKLKDYLIDKWQESAMPTPKKKAKK